MQAPVFGEIDLFSSYVPGLLIISLLAVSSGCDPRLLLGHGFETNDDSKLQLTKQGRGFWL